MTFVYEEGEQVTVGSAGEHDFVLAAGEQVTDTGESSVVFEAGNGLGAQGVIVNGTPVGYYETNDTPTGFIGQDTSQDPELQGLVDAGIIDHWNEEPYAHFMYVHHSTDTGEWSIGYATNANTDVDCTLVGSGDFFINPSDPFFKEEESGEEQFGVDSNGDSVFKMRTGGTSGDGVAYKFNPGSNDLVVESKDATDIDQNWDGPVEFVGPKDRVSEVNPTSMDVTISV